MRIERVPAPASIGDRPAAPAWPRKPAEIPEGFGEALADTIRRNTMPGPRQEDLDIHEATEIIRQARGGGSNVGPFEMGLIKRLIPELAKALREREEKGHRTAGGITIGRLSVVSLPAKPGKVWLRLQDAEGLECEAAQVEVVLKRFFTEAF